MPFRDTGVRRLHEKPALLVLTPTEGEVLVEGRRVVDTGAEAHGQLREAADLRIDFC